MEFSSQEHWSGLPCPPPGDLYNPGIEPRSPTLQVDSLLSKPPGKPERRSKETLCQLGFEFEEGRRMVVVGAQGGENSNEGGWRPVEVLFHRSQELMRVGNFCSHSKEPFTPSLK